jgi:Ethanolamine utilization protein EutJ (predicted chaperonin)
LYFTGKYVPGISVMRDGEFAYEADGTCGGLAKDFEVIQPAEVK